ncbi:MAG: hypothetical protein IKI64_06990 [Clostridia bacterium]|nr:hypothetical protein [Clostridia bacterium]
MANTTGYKGVSYDRGRRKYSARITVDAKNIFLGYFHEPETAAHAYDRAAVLYFGEYARTNFKEETDNEKILALG